MMRGWLTGLLALSLLVPLGAAAADDVAEQLRAMQERMSQLEDRLEATSDELSSANQRLSAQQSLIEQVELDQKASSGLAPFLDTLEIGGWLSASYFYNFNDPDGRALAGSNTGGFAYPFHPDANSFSLDQFWLWLERPVSEENRAGFRVDLAYGKDAGLLSGDFGAGDGFSGNDFELYQAYIQYLAPVGEGVTFQFGKFATLIGAEVVQAPDNFNITRGHVYNLFQPITHTGILASTGVAGLDVSLGFVNETRSFPANDIDRNKNKAFLWSIGGGGDQFSWSINGVHGDSDSGQGFDTPAGDKETIVDVILSYSPTEQFTTYINADYIESENSRGNDVQGYGIAWAGRLAINERLGAALRAEYVDLDDFFGGNSDLEIWGITTTVDYKLTEALTVRGEIRYDDIADGGGLFVDDESFGVGLADFDQDTQLTAGVEVIYTF
jgi:hypothetical protein